MAGCTKTSDLSAVVVGRWLAAGPDHRVRAGGLQTTRWRGLTGGGKALALASALVVGGSVEALAQDPPDPAANRVWGGCLLSEATLDKLIVDLEKKGIAPGQVKVGFVVVYTLAKDSDGQRLLDNTYTGPVICTNPGEVGITAHDKNGDPLKETTDIPTQTDQGNATKVNIRRAEAALIIQYDLDDGTNAGKTEKRVCHTTGANVDCFRIFPAH